MRQSVLETSPPVQPELTFEPDLKIFFLKENPLPNQLSQSERHDKSDQDDDDDLYADLNTSPIVLPTDIILLFVMGPPGPDPSYIP